MLGDAAAHAGECDVYIGLIHAGTYNYSADLVLGATYFASSIVAVFAPSQLTEYGPWLSFAAPFAWDMWVALAVLVALMPLVSLALDASSGESNFWRRYASRLVDSFHALVGVAQLARPQDSGALLAWWSVVAALCSRVLVSMYAVNLAAFVLYAATPQDVRTFDVPGAFQGPAWARDAVLRAFPRAMYAVTSIQRVEYTSVAVVMDEFTSSFYVDCSLVRVRIGDSSVFFSPAFPTGRVSAFDRALTDAATILESVTVDVETSWVSYYDSVLAKCATRQKIVPADAYGLFVAYAASIASVLVLSFAMPVAMSAAESAAMQVMYAADSFSAWLTSRV